MDMGIFAETTLENKLKSKGQKGVHIKSHMKKDADVRLIML